MPKHKTKMNVTSAKVRDCLQSNYFLQEVCYCKLHALLYRKLIVFLILIGERAKRARHSQG